MNMGGYEMNADSLEIWSIYYDPELNLFEDQDGQLVYDIFHYLSPGELLLLKKKRGVLYKPGPLDIMYEIVAPLCEEEAAMVLTRLY